MWQLMLISKARALQLLHVKKARGWHSWDDLPAGQQFEATLVEQDEGLGGCSHELCKGTDFTLLKRALLLLLSFQEEKFQG